ncbi:MAG: RNA polymerase sigma factor [Bernardetiaceae bacterium]
MQLDSPALFSLIEGCRKGSRKAQQKLFKACFAYGMSVCLRYTDTDTEAEEAFSEGFVKIFMQLHRYDNSRSFKGWIRRILINTAIDLHRRERPHQYQEEINDTHPLHVDESALDRLGADDIRKLIAQLPPAYRNVFNLYVIEGYNHREIADLLDISEGTSKSNLSKARARLQAQLTCPYNPPTCTPHGA